MLSNHSSQVVYVRANEWHVNRRLMPNVHLGLRYYAWPPFDNTFEWSAYHHPPYPQMLK